MRRLHKAPLLKAAKELHPVELGLSAASTVSVPSALLGAGQEQKCDRPKYQETGGSPRS